MASQFTLPAGTMDLGRLHDSLGVQMRRFGMLTGRGWLWILGANLRALSLASLLGVFTLGILAVVLLMAPVGIVGYFAGNIAFAGQSSLRFLAALVLPHAVLEIPAAVLAGAAILHLGLATLSPPQGTSLGESWIRGLAEWARIGVGLVIPLLVAAAALEVFVTPRVALWLLAGS
jgi:uncharacterized membrane protein SpoIIM required for sporulation